VKVSGQQYQKSKNSEKARSPGDEVDTGYPKKKKTERFDLLKTSC